VSCAEKALQYRQRQQGRYATPKVADAWGRMISGVCDFVCVRVSVCARFKRKTA